MEQVKDFNISIIYESKKENLKLIINHEKEFYNYTIKNLDDLEFILDSIKSKILNNRI